MHPPLIRERVIAGQELTVLCFEKSQSLRTAKMCPPVVSKPIMLYALKITDRPGPAICRWSGTHPAPYHQFPYL